MTASVTTASGASLPAAMYSATWRPTGVSAATAARSRSPEEMCSIPSSPAIRTPCVPLPPPGGASIKTFIWPRSVAQIMKTALALWSGFPGCRLPRPLGAAIPLGRAHRLPDDERMRNGLCLTDGGIETWLIFDEGLDLPAFAAFPLLTDEAGLEALRRYYRPFVALAAARGLGFIAESPTWRASPRWAGELGYSLEELDWFNRRAVALMLELREDHPPTIVSGCVGPADDGYRPGAWLTPAEARDYHATQIGTFADAGVDRVTAIT